jgi:hypothetical protein
MCGVSGHLQLIFCIYAYRNLNTVPSSPYNWRRVQSSCWSWRTHSGTPWSRRSGTSLCQDGCHNSLKAAHNVFSMILLRFRNISGRVTLNGTGTELILSPFLWLNECCWSALASMRFQIQIFTSKRIRIWIQGAKPMRIHAVPDPQHRAKVKQEFRRKPLLVENKLIIILCCSGCWPYYHETLTTFFPFLQL